MNEFEEKYDSEQIKKSLSKQVFGYLPVYLALVLVFIQFRKGHYDSAVTVAYLFPLRLLAELVSVRMKPFAFFHWGMIIVLTGLFIAIEQFTGTITLNFAASCVEVVIAIGILIYGIKRKSEEE